MPFGGLLAGGHKGSGLAAMCELLGGALASGITQRDDGTGQRRVLNGMFSVLLDPARLCVPGEADGSGNQASAGGLGGFEHEALAFIDWVKSTPPRPGHGPVQVAGEPERLARAERTAHGVPVDATTWQDILDAAHKLGLAPAQINQLAGLG
jgi:uncharacterized oxidoreductase